MANYKNKEFLRNGKDIMHKDNAYITQIKLNNNYKEGNVFTYEGKIYRATKDFTSSTAIKNNIDNNDIEALVPSSSVEIIQIIKFYREQNQEEEISISGGTKKIIDVYKMDERGKDTITLHKSFDNTDADNFYYDDLYIIFGDKAQLKTEHTDTQPSSVLDIGVVTSWNLSDLGNFQTLVELGVE